MQVLLHYLQCGVVSFSTHIFIHIYTVSRLREGNWFSRDDFYKGNFWINVFLFWFKVFCCQHQMLLQCFYSHHGGTVWRKPRRSLPSLPNFDIEKRGLGVGGCRVGWKMIKLSFMGEHNDFNNTQTWVLHCQNISNHGFNTLRPSKMAVLFQTIFSNAFSLMKMHEFCLELHWSSFLGIQLKIFQHWFR